MNFTLAIDPVLAKFFLNTVEALAHSAAVAWAVRSRKTSDHHK
jgi:hypothetical protein